MNEKLQVAVKGHGKPSKLILVKDTGNMALKKPQGKWWQKRIIENFKKELKIQYTHTYLFEKKYVKNESITGFTEVWKDTGSGANDAVTVSYLNPYFGYTCIGDISESPKKTLAHINVFKVKKKSS